MAKKMDSGWIGGGALDDCVCDDYWSAESSVMTRLELRRKSKGSNTRSLRSNSMKILDIQLLRKQKQKPID
eukprot:scaffold12882_cov73-Skeletonema_marinoi.AAC.5